MTEANGSVNQADGTTNDGGSAANSGEAGANQDTVKYETYKKVLSEKKRRDEQVKALEDQLAEIKAADDAKKEGELADQNKWKEIADLRTEELGKLKGELNTLTTQQQQALKLDAFLGSLDAKLPKAYWRLVDLNSVKINPDTNEVDDMSVSSAVELFRKSYPEVLLAKATATLPTNAPSGTAAATRGNVDESKLSHLERSKLLAADLIQLRENKG